MKATQANAKTLNLPAGSRVWPTEFRALARRHRAHEGLAMKTIKPTTPELAERLRTLSRQDGYSPALQLDLSEAATQLEAQHAMISRLRLRCLDLTDKSEELAHSLDARDRELKRLRARVGALESGSRGASKGKSVAGPAGDQMTQADITALRRALEEAAAASVVLNPEARSSPAAPHCGPLAELDHVEAIFQSLQKQFAGEPRR